MRRCDRTPHRLERRKRPTFPGTNDAVPRYDALSALLARNAFLDDGARSRSTSPWSSALVDIKEAITDTAFAKSLLPGP